MGTLIFYCAACTASPEDKLIQILKDKDSKVRSETINTLLKHDNPEVRLTACKILLNDDIRTIKLEAIIALENIKDRRAVEALATALDDKDEDVRNAAIKVLKQVDYIDVVGLLLLRLNSQDEHVRLNTVEALQRIRDDKAKDALITALNDKSDDIRVRVAWLLGVMEYKRAVVPLIEALKDESEQVSSQAAISLASLKDDRVIEPLINALADNRRLVRSAVIDALGRMKCTQAVEALIAVLNYDQFLSNREAAATALKTINDPSGISAIKLYEEQIYSEIAKSYAKHIRQGEPGTESLLRTALSKFGNKEMAEDFINCGNVGLSVDGKEWGERNHYLLTFGESDNNRPQWRSEALQTKVPAAVSTNFILTKDKSAPHADLNGLKASGPTSLKSQSSSNYRSEREWVYTVSFQELNGLAKRITKKSILIYSNNGKAWTNESNTVIKDIEIPAYGVGSYTSSIFGGYDICGELTLEFGGVDIQGRLVSAKTKIILKR